MDLDALRAVLAAHDADSAFAALSNLRDELIQNIKPKELPPLLLETVQDHQHDRSVRVEALYLLTNWYYDLDDLSPYRDSLRRLMSDPQEHPYLRGSAIDWTASHPFCTSDWLFDYIALLNDPSPDIRFWACYALSQFRETDISPARAKLDQLAAYDDALPLYFGWHIGREALWPLEEIDYYPVWRSFKEKDPRYEPEDLTWGGRSNGYFWLISSSVEYDKLLHFYRVWQAYDEPYLTKPLPPVNLQIDPDWLQQKIQRRYRKVTFNWRAPLETYLLTWSIETERHVLMGGLHRDRHSIVLTQYGRDDASLKFAVWIRSLVDSSHPLYLYNWADDGVELHRGMTVKDIQMAQQALYKSRRPPLTDKSSTPPKEQPQ